MSTFGPSYEPALDGPRIVRQMEAVRNHMLAASIRGRWETLDEIQARLESETGAHYPTPSISANLRHLKKPQFGSYKLEKRRRRSAGLWEYKLLAPVRLTPQLSMVDTWQ